MASAAEAAREFATGPQVIEAARLLLGRFSVLSLCQALAAAQPSEADHLLDALERLSQFAEVRAAFVSDEVVGFLRQGAQAPSGRARGLVAKLLWRLAQGGELGASQLAAHGLLEACEALLLDEDTGTAEAAARVVVLAARAGDQPGREQIGGTVLRLQERLASLPDVQRIRVLHLFVELGRVSDDIFADLEERGIYREVLGAFITDDILLKLNAVELMDALGSFPAGQDFLARQGVLEQLARDLTDPMCDQSIRLCVVRLLGAVLRRSPQAMPVLLPHREAPLAQAIAGMLEGRDPVDRMCALHAWADASAHPGGLAFFLSWEGPLQAVLAQVRSPQDEVCKAALAAWAAVLQGRPPPPPSPPPAAAGAGGGAVGEAPDLELWRVVETRLLPLVLKGLTGRPFPDVRTHVWGLLALLVRSRTVAQQVVPSEAMRELLLDFASESTSEARIAKHQFVVALLAHVAWLGAFLDDKVLDLLEEYARQGPHWVPRQAAAMVGDQASS